MTANPRPVLPPIPLLSTTNADPVPTTPRSPPGSIHQSSLSPPSSEAQSPTSSSASSSVLRLPVPRPSTNGSQASFTYSDASEDIGHLSAEIASADISISKDGSFVETSSGPAARELKRRFDQHFGVNKDVRSPYAITAFVNQHGREMFRVGHRDQSAPAVSAPESEPFPISRKSLPAPSRGSKRRSRMSGMSVHALPSLFRNGSSSSTTPSQSRKLRKTRSIPDLGNLIQPPVTRTHSHSVTSGDAPRLPELDPAINPTTDSFGNLMDWSSTYSPNDSMHSLSLAPTSSNASFSDDYDPPRLPVILTHPFGRGVSFLPPRRTGLDGLRQPRQRIREMQSFESNMTARQTESHKKTFHPLSPIPREQDTDDWEPERPPSAIRIRPAVEEPPPPSSSIPGGIIDGVSAETALFSHFTFENFDVIQFYRGVPILDKLLSEEDETEVIRLSANSENAAAPRNDPRFVLWGEVNSDAGDNVSVSQESFSSGTQSMRRKSKRAKSPEVPQLRIPPRTQKIIIAASIERWIAQLTSELNYDELLDFFLTYRTYIGSVDLCHLLICRFHWALQKTSSPQDDLVRRIVRLRTFVAFRYWLLTFFTVDFLPNRELRVLFAGWVNILIRDPILQKHSDGLNIVRKLKKVAEDCRRVHLKTPQVPKPRTSTVQSSSSQPHILGEKFAEMTRQLKGEPDDEDELDLDFVPVDEETMTPLGNLNLGGAVLTPPSQPPSSSVTLLQRPDHVPGPQLVPGPEIMQPFVQTSATLPIHHNALSRALVKTIGRLGRWRRVLNNRQPLPPSGEGGTTDVSAFDLELSVSRDLITVHGGVEQYLKMLDPPDAPLPAVAAPSPSTASPPFSAQAPETMEPGSTSEASDGTSTSAASVTTDDSPTTIPPQSRRDSLLSPPRSSTSSNAPSIDSDRISARTSSTDSFGEVLSPDRASARFAGFSAPYQFDIASIDELDLSDSSSGKSEGGPDGDGPEFPPGLRKVPKKLPLRRDFEFVRRSDTVSTLEMSSRRDSVASTASSSAASETGSMTLGGVIQQWQINALVESLSDDEERGDADDALRRLEGQIGNDRQQEKASKVDGWVKTIQNRLHNGDFDEDEPPLYEEDDEEEADEDEEGSEVQEVATPSQDSTHGLNHVEGDSPQARPAPEDAVPMEILQSRMPSESPSTRRVPAPTLPKALETPRMHQSFILAYPSITYAQIFTMIDKDLFTSIKFEELISEDWKGEDGKVDITDWHAYLKDRARWAAEKRFPAKTSALGALRARFNLTASFTVSEIVLTHPSARHTLVGKFIRIAWKCYSLSNFHTLVAIMSALASPTVGMAMARFWGRLSNYETRLLRDLKIFTSKDDSFKFIRAAVDAIVDAKPFEGASVAANNGGSSTAASTAPSTSTSTSRPPTTAGPSRPSGPRKSVDIGAAPPNPTCIPFIGSYLAQLTEFSNLPDLIDPTAPNTPVAVDMRTLNYEPLAHPEVFDTLEALPANVHIEPLINVHKQRLRAGVLKRLVAGQHVASRVRMECEKRLLQQVLRMRALTGEMRQRALGMYELTSPAGAGVVEGEGEVEWLGLSV
ncbi:ras GEF [Cylindrobasidium torrendii FP15055 ss-10]|uniref:Ras GEF n=1 Tax=Cylindrobasidium torrendii FP15055 ss-10 TaxID=1314674 RepID=A0A0D7BDH6_9AGAR|nr:ras GEF [Cylindrobasidium torrendii FP15055 ss-10]